ncbi:MAG: zf-HC2 domain-containing protein [Nitrospinaceae bacterium]|nr:zf-HC2 domain-containing protein [Nitrospinaceae bacterium]NIR53450.1 zf-HC2 domain-containing protein [Nitrospinaceae bacterium]NIS83853.1 zf-HC2 domain-containing protein [Nitrospinaceae bacterium]NIT80644.1 zf-HC2 domain-containing protein [Nitrospinaceae bacterium]NIU42972.1 zf-HC2 domain-containing protein [Nitrospinaceae bacterium]
MICCRECIELLCDYFEGSLDSQTASSLEDHFKDCPPCVSFLKTYRETSHLCRQTLSAVEIPEEVQSKLREFVKNNIQNH